MTKPLSEHTFEDLFVGQKVTFSEKIDESLLIDFAKLSGDFNPLHMDEDYALNTNFEKRVCHGMLLASFSHSWLECIYQARIHYISHSH